MPRKRTRPPMQRDITNPHRRALDREVDPAAQIALLRADIDRSGLSLRVWAEIIAWRDERVVRRWLNGYNPMPAIVIANLRHRARAAVNGAT